MIRRGLALGLGTLLCLGCGGESTPIEAEPAAVSTHFAKDGTRFDTAVGSLAALPDFFPDSLILPQSSLLSSGQIVDRQGGVASVLLRTPVARAELLEYYREGMWFRYWDLLSEVQQEESSILVFEYAHPEAERYQQVVIQISPSPSHSQAHEVLLLLSFDSPNRKGQGYPQKSPPADLAEDLPASTGPLSLTFGHGSSRLVP